MQTTDLSHKCNWCHVIDTMTSFSFIWLWA